MGSLVCGNHWRLGGGDGARHHQYERCVPQRHIDERLQVARNTYFLPNAISIAAPNHLCDWIFDFTLVRFKTPLEPGYISRSCAPFSHGEVIGFPQLCTGRVVALASWSPSVVRHTDLFWSRGAGASGENQLAFQNNDPSRLKASIEAWA